MTLLKGVMTPPRLKLLRGPFCRLGVETYLPVISPEIADTLKMKSLVFFLWRMLGFATHDTSGWNGRSLLPQEVPQCVENSCLHRSYINHQKPPIYTVSMHDNISNTFRYIIATDYGKSSCTLLLPWANPARDSQATLPLAKQRKNGEAHSRINKKSMDDNDGFPFTSILKRLLKS